MSAYDSLHPVGYEIGSGHQAVGVVRDELR